MGLRRACATAPRPKLAAALLAAATTVAWTPGVAAQDSGATPYPPCTKKAKDVAPSDVEGAKSAFKAGEKWFERGDYDHAIQQWRDAYSFDCTKPKLLLNLAGAYERKGDRPNALLALETYLERQPNAADAGQIQSRIDNLKAAIAANSPPPKEEKPAEPPPPVEAPPPVPATPAEAPPPAETASPSRSKLPWIVVGVGGLVTLVGGAVWKGGLDKVAEAEKTCPDRTACDDDDAITKGNDGRSAAQAGGVVTGIGVATLAGGLVWALWFNDPKPAEPAATSFMGGTRHLARRVTPVVGPGYAGVALGGTY